MLLLHGGLGLDHSYFRPWLDPLAASAELCFLDFLGNGRSSEPADWALVTHDTWTAGIDAVRAHLGWPAPVLFGHSYGAMLALKYALRWPDRVGGLILCGGVACFDYAAEAFARKRPEMPERIDLISSARRSRSFPRNSCGGSGRASRRCTSTIHPPRCWRA